MSLGPSETQIEIPQQDGDDPSRASYAQRALVSIAASILAVPPTQVDPLDDLFDLGFTSLELVEFASRVAGRFGVGLTAATLIDHRTIDALSVLVSAAEPRPECSAASTGFHPSDVGRRADPSGPEKPSKDDPIARILVALIDGSINTAEAERRVRALVAE